MVPPRQLAGSGRTVSRRYRKLIGYEVAIIRAEHWYPQHGHYRRVEALAGLQVTHYKLNMINQATTMQLHWFPFLSVKCFG